ncbi:protein phosphatase regulator [Ciborinia camelliae]|nr:protein phosphatase regulator [Ciborinia camelliae]
MADNDNHDELISQFCEVTNCSPSEAQQFLLANQWDYAGAMSEYFTSQEENTGATGPVGDSEQNETPPPPYTGPRTLDGRPAPDNGKRPAKSSAATGRAGGRGGIATLGSLNQGSSGPGHGAHMDDDDSDDPDYQPDEQPRDLFAGGEKSGLAVQDPSRKPDARKIVGDILKQAKANSRENGEPSSAPAPSRFHGSGQTLGGDDTPSQVIPDPHPRSTRSQNPTRLLHLWEDGFSVEDGPLHRFDDPANAQDLQLIQTGRAPLHLMNVKQNQDVDVQLHKHEGPYKAPPKVYKPFGGSGQRLGSPTPGGSSSSTNVQASTSAPAPTAASTATPEVHIDASQPTLTLRIQLADGTRLPARFNATHTVGDVYEFIGRASPGSNERAWVLATTFPNKEHTEKSQVLGEMPEFKRGGTAVQKWT